MKVLGCCLRLMNRCLANSSESFSEFFADNLGDFLIFLRRFAEDILETSADSLEHVLHFITIFTGSIER